MEKNTVLKKALSLLLCVVLAFTTVSFASGADITREQVSKIEIYGSDHTHNYGNWELVRAATCSTKGERRRECTVDGCSAFYTKEIAITANAHVFENWVTVSEATCSKGGTKKATCSECGYEATKALDKLDHTLVEEDWIISKAPVHGAGLDSVAGYRRNNCIICGTTVTEEIPIPHVEPAGESQVVRAPTCSTPGVGMKKCTVCGETMTVEIEIDTEAHVFTGQPMVSVAPTCQTTGIGVDECTECGKVIENVVIPIDEDAHVNSKGEILDWVVSIQPNFHADGVESVNCYYCYSQSRPVIADHGLTDEDYRITANPTCVKPGIKKAWCSNCRKYIVKEIPINDAHSWGTPEILVAADCKTEGKSVKRCARHYGHILYEVTEKTDHVYSTPWKTVIPADCNTAGTESNTCVECDTLIYRTIPIDENGHVFNKDWETVTPSECTSAGLEKNKCYECGETITRETPKHGTDNLKEISRREPTCTFDGEIFYECKKCAADVYETIPADPEKHVFAGEPAVIEAPTCQTEGEGRTVCSQCGVDCYTKVPADADVHVDKDGKILEWQTLKAVKGCENGLEYVNCHHCGPVYRTVYSDHGIPETLFNITKYSTCTVDGHKTSKNPCSKCGEYVRIPIEAGHSGILTSTVYKATCTDDGFARYQCRKCNNFYYEVIPAKGHTASEEYKVLQEATCTTEGARQRYCTTCNLAIEPPEKIPNAHIYSSWVISTAATCTTPGVRYRACHGKDCNFSERSSYVMPHSYSDWTPAEGFTCKDGGKLNRFCTVKGCPFNTTPLGSKIVEGGSHAVTKTIGIEPCDEYCYSTKVVCQFCVYENTPENVAAGIAGKPLVISENNVSHKNVIIDGEEGYKATCTTNGKTDGMVCMVCALYQEPTVIEAFGHKWDYNENGNKVCVNCGEYKVSNQDPENNPNYDNGCKCFCHDKGTIAKILYRVCQIFWKLFRINQKCECGTVHWEAEQ